MNRKEPYIGMPIVLEDFDDFEDRHDDQVPCCGKMETRPEPKRAITQQNMHHQHDHGVCENVHQPQNMQPMALAMAYVPWQKWTEVYPYDEGLKKGTIFPDLNLPFEGKRKGGMHR